MFLLPQTQNILPTLTLNGTNNFGAPRVYAHGKLGLWTLKELPPTLALLTTDTIQKIAIANPKTAPYGKASIEALKALPVSIEQVKHKLVFGESISQVNQFITTGSVDIGFYRILE